jgi:hypothetical protein
MQILVDTGNGVKFRHGFAGSRTVSGRKVNSSKSETCKPRSTQEPVCHRVIVKFQKSGHSVVWSSGKAIGYADVTQCPGTHPRVPLIAGGNKELICGFFAHLHIPAL